MPPGWDMYACVCMSHHMQMPHSRGHVHTSGLRYRQTPTSLARLQQLCLDGRWLCWEGAAIPPVGPCLQPQQICVMCMHTMMCMREGPSEAILKDQLPIAPCCVAILSLATTAFSTTTHSGTGVRQVQPCTRLPTFAQHLHTQLGFGAALWVLYYRT